MMSTISRSCRQPTNGRGGRNRGAGGNNRPRGDRSLRPPAGPRAAPALYVAKLAKFATLATMSSYSIDEAKTQLSKLVHQAEEGEEVVVRRGQKPVARIVAITGS